MPKLPRAQCQSQRGGRVGRPLRKEKGGGGGFPTHMQMRHGTNYLIGMKWVGARFHSSRITLIVLTLSKYKASAMP